MGRISGAAQGTQPAEIMAEEVEWKAEFKVLPRTTQCGVLLFLLCFNCRSNALTICAAANAVEMLVGWQELMGDVSEADAEEAWQQELADRNAQAALVCFLRFQLMKTTCFGTHFQTAVFACSVVAAKAPSTLAPRAAPAKAAAGKGAFGEAEVSCRWLATVSMLSTFVELPQHGFAALVGRPH